MEEIAQEERKEKLKSWLKNPYNLALAGILIFAIGIRIYYFFLTKNQPLWWDEADYMAYAKHLAGIENGWAITPQHSSLFPYLAAGFFKFGFSETTIKFFLEFLPSIVMVFLVYKICRLMYKDKKIALISTFLMATFWEILFNSFRFHLEGLALVTGFLAIYIFWQGYERKEKIFGKLNPNWAVPLTVTLIMLTYSIRRGFFLFGLFFLVYMLSTRKFKELFKDKYNWIALAIAIVLFFVIEKLIFTSVITEIAPTYYVKDAPFSFIPFQIFGVYFNSLTSAWSSSLFYLFYFGLITILIKLILSIGYFKTTETNESKSDFYTFLAIIITLAYFLLIQRRVSDVGDPRWYYALILGAFICISRGIITLSDYIKKYNRTIAIIVVILLIGYGGYYELQHADLIIKNKIPTYSGIKEVSLLIKQISAPTDIIFVVPTSQPSYYAERKVVNPIEFLEKPSNTEGTQAEFLSKLRGDNRVKYMIITFSEPGHPEWMFKPSQDKIELPIVKTTIYLASGNHDIQQSIIYGDIEFKLLTIKDDAFAYEIIRH